MMAIGPKMDGGPNAKYFESAEALNSLENVKNWLQKNAKKVTCYAKLKFTVHLPITTLITLQSLLI